MKINLSVADTDVPENRGKDGKHGIDIEDLTAPLRQTVARIGMPQVMQSRRNGGIRTDTADAHAPFKGSAHAAAKQLPTAHVDQQRRA